MPNVSNVVKSIQDIMRKDAGTYGDAQRLEQLGWMFFLKIFDDREKELEVVRAEYKSPLPGYQPPKNGRHWQILWHLKNMRLRPRRPDPGVSSGTGQNEQPKMCYGYTDSAKGILEATLLCEDHAVDRPLRFLKCQMYWFPR